MKENCQKKDFCQNVKALFFMTGDFRNIILNPHYPEWIREELKNQSMTPTHDQLILDARSSILTPFLTLLDHGTDVNARSE